MDAGTYTISSTVNSALNTAVSNTATATISRVVTTVYTQTLLGVSLGLQTRYEFGSSFKLILPIEQFTNDGSAVTYSSTAGCGTPSAATSAVISGNFLTVVVKDLTVTAVAKNSGDGVTVPIYFCTGIDNGRAVITAATDAYTFSVIESTSTYIGDVYTGVSLTTPLITPGTVTGIKLTYEKNYASYLGTNTFSLIPGSLILGTDVLTIDFSSALFIQPTSPSVTCKTSTLVSLPCT